jgi:hypothetical protein
MRDWNALKPFFGIPGVRAPRPKPDSSVMAHRARQGHAKKQVKNLCSHHPSIEVTGDKGDFWVFCSKFDPDDRSDPLYDAHFATSWEEVLENVMVYATALNSINNPK